MFSANAMRWNRKKEQKSGKSGGSESRKGIGGLFGRGEPKRERLREEVEPEEPKEDHPSDGAPQTSTAEQPLEAPVTPAGDVPGPSLAQDAEEESEVEKFEAEEEIQEIPAQDGPPQGAGDEEPLVADSPEAPADSPPPSAHSQPPPSPEAAEGASPGPPGGRPAGLGLRASSVGQQGLGVFVHHSERWKTKYHTKRPQLRLQVVDAASGQLLGVPPHGPLGPLLSKTAILDAQERFSWEELLETGATLDGLLAASRQPLLLVDVLDCGDQGETRGRLAWGFLRVVGEGGKLNVGPRLRLQLYRLSGETPSDSDLFPAFKAKAKRRFPASLTLALKPLRRQPPKGTAPAPSTAAVTQGDEALQPEEAVGEAAAEPAAEIQEPVVVWDRVAGQPCRIPNSEMEGVDVGGRGVTALAFSADGRRLAVAPKAAERSTDWALIVLDVPSGRELRRLRSHGARVGDLHWDDWADAGRRLLSASEDGTAKAWLEGGRLLAVLPHSAFVLAARFHPAEQSLAITGAADKLLRLWKLSGEVLRSFSGQAGEVTSLQLSKERRRLFSADSGGLMRVWSLDPQEDSGEPPLKLAREIKSSQVMGRRIDRITLDPNSRFVVVSIQDSDAISLDLRTGGLRSRLEGSLGAVEVTPCGTWVLAGCGVGAGPGSEASEGWGLGFWAATGGGQRSARIGRPEPWSLGVAAFHPLEHMVALGLRSAHTPLLLYRWDGAAEEVVVAAGKPRSRAQLKAARSADQLSDALNFSLDKLLHKYKVLGKAAAQLDLAHGPKRTGGDQAQLLAKPKRPQLARLETIGGPGDQRDRLKSIAPETFAEPTSSGRTAELVEEFNGEKLRLEKGARVEVVEEVSKDWLLVAHDGTTDYVPASALSIP